ncbi:dioxygenase [Streptomyces plumbiresistens]|uniref:Catechol dioxygenase N-terminal domain-containing protein n=1 Tax=Streptomyces plumbiresistens TaxID=511811 RepID=A0ABP7TG43_9ACTN
MTRKRSLRALRRASLTDAVVGNLAGTPDARLRQCLCLCLDVMTRRSHAAAHEPQPAVAVWESAIDFLTGTGHQCSDVRQELGLLSGVLTISAPVETLDDTQLPEVTEVTVLGPFHMVGSPPRPTAT